MTTSRRQFLWTVGAGIGALAASGMRGAPKPLAPLRRVGEPKRVIVIGAGLGGLAAAYELHRAGHDVNVLEARPLPGGRVRTLREGFADGLYAEAGGQAYYPVPENYAARYLEEFGLTRASGGRGGLSGLWHLGGRTFRTAGGVAVDWPIDLTPEERQLGLPGIRQRYLLPVLDELATLLDPAEMIWPSEAVQRFDQVSFADLLRLRGASPAAIDLLRIADRDYVGEGADAYSAVDMLGQAYNVGAASRFLSGAFFQIAGGNDLLPKAFADRLGDRVIYNAAVTGIGQSDTSLTVFFLENGREQSMIGDFAVCAIPFTVLRSLVITPPFSPEKTRAIRDLAYASLARTYIQCRQRFWYDEGLSGAASTDMATTYFWESTPTQPGPRGILHGYIMGPHAREFAGLGTAERRDFALRQAGAVFPQVNDYAETVLSISWDEEPYNRGAYAFFRPGDGQSLFPHLATPEGRVHFAGEHTSTWFLHGSMQGAIESGIRAARAINGL